eukprot:TCALIF_04603-PA protein Name:"Similar to HSD17B13 17-beta-hydroxysteroid dehydrogenase 13 (Homo sapiens)" AED:0.06 eAED:0.06 QI:0/0/0/0.66/1/1/3/0/315
MGVVVEVSTSTMITWFQLVVEICLGFWEHMVQLVYPPLAKSLVGEVVLITGAGHGIGRELALQCARLGAKVVCWDINAQTAQETAQRVNEEWAVNATHVDTPIRAWSFQCDVSKREEVNKVADETRLKVGEITVLINNAGIMPAKPMLKFEPHEIERLFDVNVFSQYWTIMQFMPGMIKRDHGHVVSMCSVAGITGTPYLVPYCSSKFAIKGLMDGLFLEMRQDMKESRVRLTTVHPFTINTGLAVDPMTRFPKLIPIHEASECAQQVIDGFRRNYEEVFVPKILGPVFRLGKCLPRRVQTALADFLNCGVGYNK